MGGSQNIGEESDNPVEINVTAMVDVIFCLCIFFMCSFHFKQLEGKIDAWLPKEKGNNIGQVTTPIILEEIRVFMRWDPARGTARKVGSTVVADDAALMDAIRVRKGDYERAGKNQFPIIVDATSDVPWSDVVRVVDLCKTDRLTSIEFAEPMQYQASNR